MIPSHLIPARLLRLLAFVACLLVVPELHAAIDVLDTMDVVHGRDRSTITIHLNIPVRYKSHAPESSGDLLRISVEPVVTSGAAEDVLLGRETMQWRPDPRVPLFEVAYEGQGFSASSINLRFQGRVEYEVPANPDFRSIVVIVKHPPGVAGSVDEAAPAVDAADAAREDAALPELAGSSPQAQGPMADLMKDANGKMTDGDYAGAIRIYTKVLQSPEHEYSSAALEYLGLARERKGQLAHAKAVYEDYLARYPEGEDADRVRQRLAGLLTARDTPKAKLKAAGARERQTRAWDVFGGFSQFYRRDENTAQVDEDDELTTVSQSSLSSDLDITGRLRTEDYDLRTRFTGGYLHDFLDDGAGNDSTVSSLYFDGRNTQQNYSMRLGRQSRSSGGVLGRFDGLLVGIPLTGKTMINLVGGAPVDSSRDSFDNRRYFYGLSVDFEGFAKGWDANTFIIEQQVDNIVDRRAVGGELRYFDAGRSFFTLVDYDILYNELNTAQVLGNWTTSGKTTINFVADYRNSPILLTSNALQGQLFDSIDAMLDVFSESEIRDIARDRTARSKLGTLGVSRPLNDKFQFSGDVTVSNFSDTEASAGVAANRGTGNEYFYNLQLIGSNLVKPGDITILGLRYIDGNTANTTSLSLNTRYPFSNDLRINPRLRIDYRKNTDDDMDQLIYKPSLRLTYRVKRSLRLEADLGGEWSDEEIVDGSDKSRSYFVSLGYRADF
jgi:tetratricopeptide (TPR) repeat protein